MSYQGDRGLPGLPGLDGERVSWSYTCVYIYIYLFTCVNVESRVDDLSVDKQRQNGILNKNRAVFYVWYQTTKQREKVNQDEAKQ